MTDFQALSEFRYQIRRFLHFSEQAARDRGLEPQQHQLLLTVKGYRSESEGPAIGFLAERLQIRHNTAVELVDRMEQLGLVTRQACSEDRRRVLIQATRRGDRLLAKLAAEHVRELRETGPALVTALEALVSLPEVA